MSKRARSLRIRAAALAVLAVGAALLSCADETPTECALYDVGAVEGYVISSGRGISVEVEASARTSTGTYFVRRTTSDSTGWYRMELPAGLYELRVDRITPWGSRDTLRVGPRIHRLDFFRGRVETDLHLPPELENRRLVFSLSLPDHPNTRFTSTSETVRDGRVRFVLPAVPAGRYIMRVDDYNSHSHAYLPGTRDAYAADSLTVGAADVAAYEADFTETYASISGRITGAWQQLDTWLWLRAFSNWGEEVASGYTEDGSFTLDFLVPERVRLSVTQSGYRWLGGDTFETARVFDLKPGDRITDVSAVFSGVKISLEGPGHLIQHRAKVLIRFDDGYEFEFIGGDGVYVSILPAGRCTVGVTGYCDKQIWAPQWYEGAESEVDATPVDLAEGELKEIAFRLVEGGRIAGQLLTSTGERPQAAFCYIHDSTGERLCDSQDAFPGGVFELTGLPDGEYYLSASLYRSGDAWWYPGTFNFEEAVRIPIVGHEPVTGIVWSLPPLNAGVQP